MRQIYKLLNFRNRAMEILRYTYDNMERLLTTSVHSINSVIISLKNEHEYI